MLNAARRFRHSGEQAALTKAQNLNVRLRARNICAPRSPDAHAARPSRPQRAATVRAEFRARDQGKVHSLVETVQEGGRTSVTITEEQLAGAL